MADILLLAVMSRNNVVYTVWDKEHQILLVHVCGVWFILQILLPPPPSPRRHIPSFMCFGGQKFDLETMSSVNRVLVAKLKQG